MKKKKAILFALIILLAFFLNLIWEFSHAPLYNHDIPNSILILATLGDVMYLAIIFLIISLFNKNIKWLSKPKTKDYILTIILGLIFAILIEVKAQMLNKWSYNELMPTIFGIGLTPLIELAITGVLTLFIINKLILNNPTSQK